MVIAEGIVAKIIGPLVATVFKPIAASIGEGIKDFTLEKWKRYQFSFEQYLASTQDRHKYFSSPVFSNEGKLLEDYYVPLTLEKGTLRTNSAHVQITGFPDELFSLHSDILIIDTAGMGKSTLLKYLFLKQIQHGGAIPIFVELRRISKEKRLLDYVFDEIGRFDNSITTGVLERILAQGKFAIFLDGFDEVADSDKRSVSEDILALRRLAEKSNFVLSSRQEQSLNSLAEFQRFRIRPLTKVEAFCLIRLLSPIPERAESLIHKLGDEQQGNLLEFLKNPLLVSLLVKSYLHTPILPVRLSEFYRQVFDALYQNHDAQKELWGFVRQKLSGLDMDRFHKAMRALGYLTYRDSKLEFSTDEIHNEIEKVKALTLENTYSAESFCDDLLRAVPLFVREGNKVRWAHRSLQEYFAAAYICMDSKGKQEAILIRIYENSLTRNANVLKLCADIDEKTFKRTVVRRFLEENIERMDAMFQHPYFSNIPPGLLIRRREIPGLRFMYLYRFSEILTVDDIHTDKTSPELYRIIDATDGYWTLRSELDISPDEHGLEYLVMDSEADDEFLSLGFINYLPSDIMQELPEKVLIGTLNNIVPNTAYQFDENPANPLNSLENFELATNLLANLKRFGFNLPLMRKHLDEIVEAERIATELEVDF